MIMTEMKMNYLLIKKEIGSEKELGDICKKILCDHGREKDDNHIEIDVEEKKIELFYDIKIIKNLYYLELIVKDTLKNDLIVLNRINGSFKTSQEQKYFELIVIEDGISEHYCRKLYPKIAVFERLLRELVIILLAESNGIEWFDENATKDIKKSVKKLSGNEKKRTNNKLEYLDMGQLSAFLFIPPDVDVYKMFNDELSEKRINGMSVGELKSIIEKYRPKSLWDNYFYKFGSKEEWEQYFAEIHDIRNRVAHNKSIYKEEFEAKVKLINKVNRKLRLIIDNIRKQEHIDTRGIVTALNNLKWAIRFLMKDIDTEGIARSTKLLTENMKKSIKYAEGLDMFYKNIKYFKDMNLYIMGDSDKEDNNDDEQNDTDE